MPIPQLPDTVFFMKKDDLNVLRSTLSLPDTTEPSPVIAHALRSAFPDAQIAEDQDGAAIQIAEDKAHLTCVESDDRITLGLQHKGDVPSITAALKDIMPERDAQRLVLKINDLNPTLDVETKALLLQPLPELRRMMDGFVDAGITDTVQVTVTLGDDRYLEAHHLPKKGCLGVFFAQTQEPGSEDSLFSDHGFEVILNMDAFQDFAENDVGDRRDAISLFSTLPHEIMHAINFANASKGMTPLEVYDHGCIVDVNDRVIEKFGSFGNEEEATEDAGLVIAANAYSDAVCNALLPMAANAAVAQKSASFEP